jgi:hypothetical protein
MTPRHSLPPRLVDTQPTDLTFSGGPQAAEQGITELSQLILRYLTVIFQLSLDRLPRREHTPVPGNA